jgi:hypothetical protein
MEFRAPVRALGVKRGGDILPQQFASFSYNGGSIVDGNVLEYYLVILILKLILLCFSQKKFAALA